MTESVALYAVPTIPLGRLVVVILSGLSGVSLLGAFTIVTLKPADTLNPTESVTWSVKV